MTLQSPSSPAPTITALVLATALFCAVAPVAAADDVAPTFYLDVLPILQENCQVCHREGGANMGGMIAPMALLDYAQVRPWAKSIARNVSERLMPPWHASAEHAGIFANERTLSQSQIDTVVAWVETGAPAGDPADGPPPREWLAHDGCAVFCP